MAQAQDYEVFTYRELFVVRWRNPDAHSGYKLTSEIERHYRSQGRSLFFAILIGPDCPPPDGATRESLLRHHDRIYELTLAVRTVILGSNVRQTVMRSAMTALTLAAGLRGRPFKVDKSVSALVEVIEHTLGHEAQALLESMVASGIVSAEEAGLPAASPPPKGPGEGAQLG